MGNREVALDKILQSGVAVAGPRWHVRSIKEAFETGIAYVFLSGIILLLAIILSIGTNHRTETQLVSPLQDMLQCVEAAATRRCVADPGLYWSRDEVGQLAQAVGRLISVLARSENLVYHLAALVESSGEAIISHTLDGTILSWNKGAQRVYGYSAEEMKGRSITLLSLCRTTAPEMTRILRRIQNGERVQPFETIHQRATAAPFRRLYACPAFSIPPAK